MLTMILSIVLVTLLFGLTIFVHELGHFLVARWCGMTVDAFAIGMGPAIWKRKINGVEYKLCAFPIGGYVALPQMDPSGSPGVSEHEPERQLPPAKPLAKILVGLAGVTFNMIFAIFLAYVIFWENNSIAPEYETSTVGYVETNSIAFASGVRVGDVINAVNGESVPTWEQFIVVAALREQVTLNLHRGQSEDIEITLPTEKIIGGRIVPGLYPKEHIVVLELVSGSPAANAGIQPRDHILSLNSQTLYSRFQMIELISQSEGSPIVLGIERGGKPLSLTLIPQYDSGLKRAVIGIGFDEEVKKPWAQIKSHATLIFRILKALVTPSESRAASEAIGGPVAIIDIFLMYAANGIMKALTFACLLNVNLAVMNLLPLPVLDGGHIMFSLYEMITRRPAPAKLVNFLWKTSAVLLLSVFLLLTYRDVSRIFTGMKKTSDKPEPAAVEQEPEPELETTKP